MRHKGVNYSRYGYIFSLPFILIFLVFSLYPIIYTLAIGFTNMQGIIPKPLEILDNPFQNFKDLILENASFKKSLVNTGLLWMINFIPQIGLALLLTAWFTNKRLILRAKVRSRSCSICRILSLQVRLQCFLAPCSLIQWGQ